MIAGTYSVFLFFTVTEGASPFEIFPGKRWGPLNNLRRRPNMNSFQDNLNGQLTVLHTFAEFRGDELLPLV